MKKSMAEKILALLEKGWKAKEIAEKLNVSPAYVYVVKSKNKTKTPKTPKTPKKDEKKEAKKTGNRLMTSEEADAWVDAVMAESLHGKVLKTPEPSVDMVNHPRHYKFGGIETIDFIEAKHLTYNLGNVVKYVSRADHKGNRLEDLKKARFYLDREINQAEA